MSVPQARACGVGGTAGWDEERRERIASSFLLVLGVGTQGVSLLVVRLQHFGPQPLNG